MLIKTFFAVIRDRGSFGTPGLDIKVIATGSIDHKSCGSGAIGAGVLEQHIYRATGGGAAAALY